MKYYIYDSMDSGAAFKVEASSEDEAYRKCAESYYKKNSPYMADTLEAEIEQLKDDAIIFSETELQEIE